MKKDKYKDCKPETMMLGFGYDPHLSENSVKPPVFLTSTFAFEHAVDGKRFFEVLHGSPLRPAEKIGLIYSRMNNPGIEILEDRLTCWENAEAAIVFSSGMSTIATTILALCQAGDSVIFSEPIYGGTVQLFRDVLPKYGIQCHSFDAVDGVDGFRFISQQAKNVRLVFLETPANPTNILVDIETIATEAKKTFGEQTIIAVDNTFLGPVFQRPLKFGADVVIYSATKFLGGHSDIVAGVCYGKKSILQPVRKYRSVLGSNLSPFDGWLILRSMETLKIRMDRESQNAEKIAEFLVTHPKVKKVYYPGLLKQGDPQFEIYRKQCSGPGSLISFDIQGGEKEAFQFLDSVKLVHLAVSLGGTETLVQHPKAMTHSGMTAEAMQKVGITDSLIRLSVGIEDADDLINDLRQALDVL